MRIALISDSHDNIPNLDKALSEIIRRGISVVIHCGDISYRETFLHFIKKFPGKIFAVTGNASDTFENFKTSIIRKDVELHQDFGFRVFGSLTLAWCHYPRRAEELAETGKYDFVFYGHTHTPWEALKNVHGKNVTLLNPGALDGSRLPPTFGVFNTKTKKTELVLLRNLP